MTAPTPRPGILDIAPYVPGSAKAPGAAKLHKLSSNESALGASDKAIAAYRAAGDSLHLYPDGSAARLREKLAATYGLDPSRIVCGAGSDELIQLLVRAYVGPGDNIVMSENGFLMYPIAATAAGAEVRRAAETDLTADVDALLAAADARTRVVFLANPNNPTGTYIPDAEVRRLRNGLRDDVLLVIDGAYAEYMEEADYSAGEALVEQNDNVVMLRTFSKIYGLGGLRIGWGYFPAAVADIVNRIRGPFNMNVAAIEAGTAALDDQDFVARNRDYNRAERAKLADALTAMGLAFAPSFGNFILVRFPDAPGRRAADVQDHLRAKGVLVREMNPYKLDDWLRISIGAPDANQALIAGLEELFGG